MFRWLLFGFIFIFSMRADASALGFEKWKQSFRKQALEQGVDSVYLDSVLPDMQLLPRVVQSDRKQPEFHSTFWDYFDKRVNETRINQGKENFRKYRTVLNQAAQKYGVPAHYILSFWGLETNYGSYKGNIETLNALTTLAYDKRRRDFFTKQLISFLRISQKNQLVDIKGSWAGAFGHFQFIPTTFEAYAVDGDGDGRIDIVNSIPDAIESAANYLSRVHWNKAQRWGREVKVSSNTDWSQIHLETPMRLKQWADLGILPADGSDWKNDSMDMMGELIMPMGAKGPLFLVYPNFRVIMKWNKSILYALCVGILADRIVEQADVIYAPRHNNHFSYKQAKELQQKLTEKGYYSGSIDGDLGKKTRQAIVRYQKDNSLPVDGYATEELLNKLNN